MRRLEVRRRALRLAMTTCVCALLTSTRLALTLKLVPRLNVVLDYAPAAVTSDPKVRTISAGEAVGSLSFVAQGQ